MHAPHSLASLPAAQWVCRTIYQSKLIEYDDERNLAVFWVRKVLQKRCHGGWAGCFVGAPDARRTSATSKLALKVCTLPPTLCAAARQAHTYGRCACILAFSWVWAATCRWAAAAGLEQVLCHMPCADFLGQAVDRVLLRAVTLMSRSCGVCAAASWERRTT